MTDYRLSVSARHCEAWVCREWILFAVLCPLFSILGCLSLATAEENLGAHILIVANGKWPDSVKIANYYAEKRNVPREQICLLECPTAETISRADFIKTIQDPIREFLETKGLLMRAASTPIRNKIRYMVLCYGVPLKVASDPKLVEAEAQRWPEQFRRNEAAIDSELALLPVEFRKTGVIRNPLYNRPNSTFAEPMNLELILVTRLDGPNAETAKALIDRALEGEAWGIHGRGYFDARGITKPGYVEGDNWIRKCHEFAKRAGFECVLDENEPIFDEGYAMTDCVLYAGWYTGSISGAPARKSFRFRPGAIAYHLHSDSGGTVRHETTCWVGPFVLRGVACTMGCVYEPYLPGSPNVAIFFERLLQGHTFAESAYASQQWLSWQTTFVGDPLYRPFAKDLGQQIAALEKAGRREVVFAYLRRINLLWNGDKRDEAMRLAREYQARLADPVLSEKIADMLCDGGDLVGAIPEYKEAARTTRDDWQAIRLHYKIADAYQKLGKDHLALQSLETILQRSPNYEGKVGLYLRMIPLAYKIGPKAKADAWKAEALKLNPSLTNNPSLRQ